MIASFGFLLANQNAYKTNGKSSTFFIGFLLFTWSQVSLTMLVSRFYRYKRDSFAASLWIVLVPFAICVSGISELIMKISAGN